MKKNEKLLEAIGQIDDRLVEEAAHAGRKVTSFAAAKETTTVKHTKKKKTKAAFYRWQGALAACAVVAVCIGIYSLLNSQGLLLSPFGGRTESVQMAADQEPAEEAVAEEAAAAIGQANEGQAEIAVVTADEAVLEEALPEAPAEEAEPDEAVDTSGKEDTVTDGVDQAAQKEYSGAEQKNTGEGNAAQAEQTTEIRTAEERGRIPAVSVQVTNSSPASLTWSLTNAELDRKLYYGSSWYLEMNGLEGWQEVIPVEEAVWTQQLYVLKPGKTMEETVDVTMLYGELTPGSYRLVRQCEIGEEEEIYMMYVEFVVK